MNIFQLFIGEPLYNIYMNTPYFGWDGKQETQICSLMTGIHEGHWISDGSSECRNMISRNFTSRLILIRSLMQIYILTITASDLFYIARRKFIYFFIKDNVYDTARFKHF